MITFLKLFVLGGRNILKVIGKILPRFISSKSFFIVINSEYNDSEHLTTSLIVLLKELVLFQTGVLGRSLVTL